MKPGCWLAEKSLGMPAHLPSFFGERQLAQKKITSSLELNQDEVTA